MQMKGGSWLLRWALQDFHLYCPRDHDVTAVLCLHGSFEMAMLTFTVVQRVFQAIQEIIK